MLAINRILDDRCSVSAWSRSINLMLDDRCSVSAWLRSISLMLAINHMLDDRCSVSAWLRSINLMLAINYMLDDRCSVSACYLNRSNQNHPTLAMNQSIICSMGLQFQVIRDRSDQADPLESDYNFRNRRRG
jgi:hypothetical protein